MNTDYPAFIATGQLLATVPVAIALYALLAFPSGRLTTGPARTLTALGYLVTTVVLAPQYLFTPLPAPNDPLFVADRPTSAPSSTPPGRFSPPLAALTSSASTSPAGTSPVMAGPTSPAITYMPHKKRWQKPERATGIEPG